MNMKSIMHKIPLIIIAFSILELLINLKVQSLIGAKTLFFSASYIVGPVIGALLGTGIFMGILGLRRMTHYMVFGTAFAGLKSLYLPTMAASIYWNNTHAWIRCIVPLACMAAFVAHPVGLQSFMYAAYWFIPVLLYVLKPQGIFFTALGATYVQHAVGSVIWLYTVPTVPALWNGLIPVVFFERLLYAAAMTLVMVGINYISDYTLQNRKRVSHKAS